MKTWDAVALAAEKAPMALAALAEIMGSMSRSNDNLREEAIRAKESLALACDRHKREVEGVRDDARRVARATLGDGWHTLRVGGDFLVKDGVVRRARCADESKRTDVEKALKDAFGVWLESWSETGEAWLCDIPF